MRSVYKVLAYLIAIEVAIQAAAMAFAIFGLGVWIEEGGVLNTAAFESGESLFPEEIGFALHAINGMMVIPALALILLIVSFFAKVPGGVKWAAVILGLVALQVVLGMFGHGLPALGLLHGLNAIALFTTAFITARRVSTATPAEPESRAPARAMS